MCNTPGAGGGQQHDVALTGTLKPPVTGSEDLAQRNFMNAFFGAGRPTGLGSTGTDVGGILGAVQSRLGLPTTYQTPTLNGMGLLPEQAAGLQQPFQQAVQQSLGQFSSNYANRGFMRPENIQAIAGSAAQNVAPQFANLYANLAQQNVAQRTQAPLITEEQTRQRFADMLQALGMTASALSGTQQAGSGLQNSNLAGQALAAYTKGIGSGASKMLF